MKLSVGVQIFSILLVTRLWIDNCNWIDIYYTTILFAGIYFESKIILFYVGKVTVPYCKSSWKEINYRFISFDYISLTNSRLW